MVDAAYYQDLLRPIFAGRKLVIVIKPHQERTHEHALASDAGAYRVARPGQTAAASLLIGPSTVGGFLRFTPDPAHMPVGPSIARAWWRHLPSPTENSAPAWGR